MRRLFLFLLITGFMGCSQPGIPKDILKPEKMQAVYWDYLKADIFANEYITRDSSLDDSLENARLQLQVFKLHNITRQEFYKSYEYYLNHRDLMKDMLDTMLVRQKKEVKKKDSAIIKVADSLTPLPEKGILDTIIQTNE